VGPRAATNLPRPRVGPPLTVGGSIPLFFPERVLQTGACFVPSTANRTGWRVNQLTLFAALMGPGGGTKSRGQPTRARRVIWKAAPRFSGVFTVSHGFNRPATAAGIYCGFRPPMSGFPTVYLNRQRGLAPPAGHLRPRNSAQRQPVNNNTASSGAGGREGFSVLYETVPLTATAAGNSGGGAATCTLSKCTLNGKIPRGPAAALRAAL